MNPTHACPTCNVLLPIDAPKGLCPSCLLRWALETLAGEETSPLTLRESHRSPLSGPEMSEPGGSEDEARVVGG
jgi:hypothetical protein